MDPDNPALNGDGSDKDAKDIEWNFSPTNTQQPTKISTLAPPASPTPAENLG